MEVIQSQSAQAVLAQFMFLLSQTLAVLMVLIQFLQVLLQQVVAVVVLLAVVLQAIMMAHQAVQVAVDRTPATD
jgi:hypothetical protein